MIIERRIVQYRVPDPSRIATKSYYTIIEYLQDALMLLIIIWVPLSLIRLMVVVDLRMSLSTRIGLVAFLSGMIILRWDPFGMWFYYWD